MGWTGRPQALIGAYLFDQSGVALNPSAPPASCTISSYVPTNFQLKRLKGTYSLQVTELLQVIAYK